MILVLTSPIHYVAQAGAKPQVCDYNEAWKNPKDFLRIQRLTRMY